MIRINFEKLSASMEPFKNTSPKKEIKNKGLGNVIMYIWNHYPIRKVDLDSFTVEDVKAAAIAMDNIPFYDEDDFLAVVELEAKKSIEEDLKNRQVNPFLTNRLVENSIFDLHKSDKKIYMTDDDFI